MTATAIALHHLTIAQAGAAIARRDLSPVDLVEGLLDRIGAVDDRVHSYITVTAERARASAADAAREIAAGCARGPLHGIPFAVKDNFHVAGIRTTAASRLMLDHVPAVTATAITRLESAGAILLGKLNTWELGTGSGAVNDDLPFPIARNPWDLERLTGGSSTGPAAGVAAGTATFALGSDTGGSIRLPAAACGLVGLKPTYGLVSRAGCLPNCWSLDHNGPLTWTVEDAAIVLEAIAGFDEADPSSVQAPRSAYRADLDAGISGLTLGVVRDFGREGEALDPAQARAFDEMVGVLRDLGAVTRQVRLPAALTAYSHVMRIINWAESFSAHEQDFLERRHLMGESLQDKMTCGSLLRAADYIAALRHRRLLAGMTDDLVRTCHALVLPGAFHVAPPASDPVAVPAYTAEHACSVFNLTGHPAMVVCTGFHGGLPLNAQIAGPAFGEGTILRVARAYERATTWRDRRPVL